MDLLRSSICDKEFINYRKYTESFDRKKFSKNVRTEGIGLIPIVVDTVDPELYYLMSKKQIRFLTEYKGVELSLHMDSSMNDILNEIKCILLQKLIDSKNTFDATNELSKYTLKLGLENGTLIEQNFILGDLYKKYKNNDDNILYLLLSKENSIYAYLMSIIKYIFTNIKNTIY